MDDPMDERMDRRLDERLSSLVVEAVADVEPADRLAEIRSRTRPRRSRQGWYAAGGAVLTAAAAVTAIALVANQPELRTVDPGPAHDPTPTFATSSVTPTAPPDSTSYPLYFLGETPVGTRLYREFQRAAGPTSLQTAIQLLAFGPGDPDYRTAWPVGSFETADYWDSLTVHVDLTDDSLHDRPASMTRSEAELAIQQVVYTVQAVAERRVAVQFRLNGNPIDTVFGVPTSEPLAAGAQLDELALVSISNPSEGLEVEDSFVADGRASSFEGNVPWELRDSSGAVVRQGFAQAGMDDHLIPWKTERIDVSDLAPGTYTFVAMTDDPSSGEGSGPFTDTRTVLVR
jgi:anti-sigma factor RsiW